MGNVFVKIADKVWDVVKYPFVHAAQVAHILAATGEDAPEVKSLIVQLVEEGEKVGADAFVAIGAGGLNLPDDLNAIKDAQAFFLFFKDTFLPGVEKIYKDIVEAKKTDPEPPSAPPNPVPVAAPATETASGLAAA